MIKLGKKIKSLEETIEAYACACQSCSCPCVCQCGSGADMDSTYYTAYINMNNNDYYSHASWYHYSSK